MRPSYLLAVVIAGFGAVLACSGNGGGTTSSSSSGSASGSTGGSGSSGASSSGIVGESSSGGGNNASSGGGNNASSGGGNTGSTSGGGTGSSGGGTWVCDAEYQGADDGCDCGCGAPDPDCGGAGCTEPGCDASGCEACWGPGASEIECAGGSTSSGGPEGWTCDPAYYGDEECDCGCGVADSDCGGAGCTMPGACADTACAYCYDANGDDVSCVPPPPGWTCDGLFYGDGGSCDCGCGIADTDCTAGGCTEPGCRDAACDACYDAQGNFMACEAP
ncbi:MAG: hypothetical protein AB2A00_04675 [Myxococcota bacterium]